MGAADKKKQKTESERFTCAAGYTSPPPRNGMLYSLQTDKPVAQKYRYFPIRVCVVGAGSGEMGNALTMRASPELAPVK